MSGMSDSFGGLQLAGLRLRFLGRSRVLDAFLILYNSHAPNSTGKAENQTFDQASL